MSNMEEIVQGGVPPEVTEALIPADPVDQNKPPDNQVVLQTDSGAGENESSNPTATQKFTNIRNEERIVSIDRQRSVETQADKQMSDLLDLLESLRSKKIMTGKIAGVETTSSGIPSAVLQYGEFKVVIPCFECVNPPADFRDQEPNTVYQYILSKHLGAEIDFVVKGIDQEGEVVVASRKEAMAIRRRQFYFGKDRDGNNLLYEGAVAEARVVSVIRAGIFVELFGVHTYIPVSELSYQRILDAAAYSEWTACPGEDHETGSERSERRSGDPVRQAYQEESLRYGP